MLTGYGHCKSVVTGNAQAEVVALLLEVCAHLGLQWLIEQPPSSLLFQWPSLLRFFMDGNVFSIHIDLAHFGCVCSKPLLLRGTWDALPFIKCLEAALEPYVPPREEKPKGSKPSGRPMLTLYINI